MKALLASTVLVYALATVSVAEDYRPSESAKSMFLDEVSSTEWYRHAEFLYGLEEGKTYDISFMMLKEPGMQAKAAYFAAYITIRRKKGSALHWVLNNVGSEVPADGKWHEVKTSFTFKLPKLKEGERVAGNLNGAYRVVSHLYNKVSNGRAIKVNHFQGLPKYVNYRFLGAKDPKLPKILLVGDSTMQHTYPATVDAFKGVANVYFIPVNAGNTARSVGAIRLWVGEMKWDVIYFNSGIHDLTRVNRKGQRGADYPNAVPPEQYARNLEAIVDYLKTVDATVVWRSITQLGPNAAGRLQSDEQLYNGAARKVMERHKVLVHDVTSPNRERLLSLLKRDGVHYTENGNRFLAREFFEFVKKNGLIRTK